MEYKSSKGNKNIYKNEILHALLKDPTKSSRTIAKELKSYRQKIWREKKNWRKSTLYGDIRQLLMKGS